MSKRVYEVKSLKLAHTKDSKIMINHIEHPYGDHSDPILELSITKDGEVDSKVEIPYANLEAVLKAMQASEDVCKTIIHEHFHDELRSDVGGGQ